MVIGESFAVNSRFSFVSRDAASGDFMVSTPVLGPPGSDGCAVFFGGTVGNREGQTLGLNFLSVFFAIDTHGIDGDFQFVQLRFVCFPFG